MELTKLILKNFRSHRDLKLNFDTGVTGICGTNGTGKSSIVEAIVFMLTGEGYGKTKSEMLTVGQTSGYVIGHMLIDGKEAVLERHIDTAKLMFSYDGKVYKKSGDVAEIWNKLFQIDKHILQSVVVSAQKEIALLVSGDTAVKEKLFQKIFMVPNTTKLRDIIWNSYIKMAPPEYPVKNTSDLLSEVQTLEKLLEYLEEELANITVNNEEFERLVARKAYLAEVKSSEALAAKLNAEIPAIMPGIESLQKQIETITSKLGMLHVEDYEHKLALLASNKTRQAAKDKLLGDLEVLKKTAIPVGGAIELLEKERVEASKAYSDAATNVAVSQQKVADLAAQLKKYDKWGEHGECPTCGTQLDDISQLVSRAKDEMEKVKSGQDALLQLSFKTKREYDEIEFKLETNRKFVQALEKINAQLDAYADVAYDPEEHKLCSMVVTQHNELSSQLRVLQQSLAQEQAKLQQAQLKLAAVKTYDKDAMLLDVEIYETANQLAAIESTRARQLAARVDVATKNAQLATAKRDYADNEQYIAKNAKRNKYMSVLNGLYDVFHTTKFPRMLIQTYSSTVTEYMNTVLEAFNFPYTAKVNESFGIDVYNAEGLRLPSISGGQEVMIGFSLRMALHNMFVGAFPFMIIDEGSYGLAEEATLQYFGIIAGLNKVSKFKQVIIIDHHKELADYVDHTIML